MYLFKEQGESIQPGLFSSMVVSLRRSAFSRPTDVSNFQYLYRDSDRWEDLRTLLWHNK